MTTLLEHLTYKPGYRFRFRARPLPQGDDVELYVEADVPDSEKPTHTVPAHLRTVKLLHRHRWSHHEVAMFDRDQFLWTVRSFLVEMEVHEVDEWFRLDGAPVHEPHPERHGKTREVPT